MTSPSSSHAETGQIGRYSLLARIGEGGMGVVHLAQAPTGERVALKVLRPHVVGDDEGRERLAREVGSLRRVRSRRVAEVHDADPWGERPYVVTRYVHGPSLHERVREEGTLDGDGLRAIAVGLAEAMIAVHDAGVLHRDIKPSNVLIEGQHDPVLIDFGLAKLAEDSRLTATGWLMGTPGYLAPEVLYGDEATPAADVHAWAATVVYAATGTTPFGRGPTMAVMDRARRGEHDLSGVPPWLRPLLTECLAPDPAHRPRALDVLAWLNDPAAARGRYGAVPAPAPVAPTRPITVAQPYAPTRRPERGQDRSSRRDPPAGRSHVALRALLMVGLLLVFAAALALAPYVTVGVAFVAAWAVRTASCSMDAMSDRRVLRGERRSDGLVRTLTAPWHLLRSLPGTVLLLLGVASSAGVVTGVLWALQVQDSRSLFAGGVVGALALWWGPGSRRLRRATRRVVWRTTRPEPSGLVSVGLVLGVVVLLAVSLGSGVVWWPDDGPPFDPQVLVPPGFR